MRSVVNRRQKLRKRYGLEIEEYERLLESQAGVCAICAQAPSDTLRLSVDHDHLCGKSRAVRGLLCSNCNRGIGHLRERQDLLVSAAAYLRKWHAIHRRPGLVIVTVDIDGTTCVRAA